MNRLSSKQRKFLYFGGILVLLIPIIWLGMPSASEQERSGKLSELRYRYDLGESQLGKVNPTSAAMNLVLLGFRGIAADLIWVQAIENEDTKNWAELRSNVDTIIMLQPHFIKVWDFQGHNLAYNISATWDLVADRYYWVKEGAKFLKQGCLVNKQNAFLPYAQARVIGNKIGRADEWEFYRKFFNVKDPNEEFYKGRPDPEINPEGKDNYLAAKDLYLTANELEIKYPQSVPMMRIMFRSNPYRAQMSYPDALQREGVFDEVSRTAWEEAYREWVNIYGQERYEAPAGDFYLDISGRDVDEQARIQHADPVAYRNWVQRMQSQTRYTYWKTRSQAEAQQLMVKAHKAIYDGQQDFRKGSLSTARDTLYNGMTLYQQLLDKYEILASDDEAIEEGLTAVLYWQKILKLQLQPVPETYPLSGLWAKQHRFIPDLERRFKRQTGQD